MLRTPFSRRLFLAMSATGSFVSSILPEEPVNKTVKIHFLHHSTGGNLIGGAGGIGKMFDEYNRQFGADYRFTHEWSIPDGNNYPYDYYADTFAPARLQELAAKYNVVIWKHCYPGSAVLDDTGKPDINSSRKSIENYKLQYRALRDRMDTFPETKFMLWTLPPLHRKASTADMARRASEFTEWVKHEYLRENGDHPNQFLFDFRGYITGGDHFLLYEYELDHNESDSHPNQRANDTVCPVFFRSILDILQHSVSVADSVPGGFLVEPAYPNPANPVTVIRFRIPESCHVRLTVFDRLGKKVAVLRDGWTPAGAQQTVWNGQDRQGRPAASGVYFYSFSAKGFQTRGKITLLR
ncbi:MAG: FlgD immunoglobulin-like domain containing protein [Candidatus Latescibacterota bacterium]